MIVPLLVGLALVACSIKQNVRPVTSADLATREICIRENKTVREGFLEAYRQALESKGFSVRMLDPDAGIRACPLLTTYTANWRWDLALYMAYAELTVFRDGNEIGKATYDALMGGGRMDKFIKADEKVRELVSQLFPG
ncbi:MAG: hypothetical protein DMD84_27825 [Candidatus Rokuibacteriota bacterium]|nr:MAG: hypothetical protein DMD84_27825 [Candidatus Rokubacteria bacterium]